MVNVMETWLNKGSKQKLDRIHQYHFARIIVLFDREFDLEKYYGAIVSSRISIWIDKQMYRGQNQLFIKISKFE